MSRLYVTNDTQHDVVEKELCLNLARQIVSSNLVLENSDNVEVTIDNFDGSNFKITDNGSINSNNIIIASKYHASPIESYPTTTLTLGNVDGQDINSEVSLTDKTNAVMDASLKFDVTLNTEFDSLNEDWHASFDGADSNVTLSVAVNSQLNNKETNKSLLSILGDLNHNNNQAFGLAQSVYFTQDEETGAISTTNLDPSNVMQTNDMGVNVDVSKFSNDGSQFGAYKLTQNEATTIVDFSKDNNGDALDFPLFVNDVTQPSSGSPSTQNTQIMNSEFFDLPLESYYRMFPNHINNGSTITINVSDNNGGYYVEDQYVQLDNSTLVDNYAYMMNDYAKKSHAVEIHQDPLVIQTENDNAMESNIAKMTLTENGETLNGDNHLVDGHVEIAFDTPNDRHTVLSATSDVFTDYVVSYGTDEPLVGGTITSDVKESHQVKYEVKNIVLSTHANDYGAPHTSNSSLLFTPSPSNFNINFTSNYEAPENVAAHDVNIYVTKNLINLDDNRLFAVSDADGDESNDVRLDILNDIEIKNISLDAFTYDDLQMHYESKTIEDLNLNISGDSANSWQLSYSDDAEYLKTSVNTLSLINNFPYVYTAMDVINNDLSLNVTLTYGSIQQTTGDPNYLFDQVTISYVNENGENVDKLITDNEITKLNENIISVVYEDITSHCTSLNGTPVTNYKILKITTVSTYISEFKLNLGPFSNLKIRTPLLKSTVKNFHVYVPNGFTISDNGASITYNGRKLAFAYTNTILYNEPGVVHTSLPTLHSLISETIVNYATLSPTVINMRVSRDSLLTLKGTLQGRNKSVGSEGYSNWVNIFTNSIDVDAYYGTQVTVLLENIVRSVSITPSRVNIPSIYSSSQHVMGIVFDVNSHNLVMDYQNYYIPIVRNNDETFFIESSEITKNNLVLLARYDNDETPTKLLTTYDPRFNSNDSLSGSSMPNGVAVPLTFTVTYLEADPSQAGPSQVKLDIFLRGSVTPTYTIIADNAGFIQNMRIFHADKAAFLVQKYIDEDLVVPNALVSDKRSIVYGENDDNTIISNANGHIVVDSGVVVSYSQLAVDCSTNFTLKADKVSVILCGDVENMSAPAYLDNLVFTQANCETLTLSQYRGYDNIGSLSALYKINRADNATKLNLRIRDSNGNLLDSMTEFTMYVNREEQMNFEGVGLLGVGMRFTQYSRYPVSDLDENYDRVVPIAVVGDNVSIIFDNTVDEPLVISKTLKDISTYDVFVETLPNGTVNTRKIYPSRVKLNTDENLTYSIEYYKASVTMYKSSSYLGNPASFTYQYIDSKPFELLSSEMKFTHTGFVEDGPFTLLLNLETIDFRISTNYWVVAPPLLSATIAQYNAASDMPFSSHNASRVVTRHHLVENTNLMSLNLFSGIADVNDINLSQTSSKGFVYYNDMSESDRVHFNVHSSSLVITQHPVLSSIAGPGGNLGTGVVLYDGLIENLVKVNAPDGNLIVCRFSQQLQTMFSNLVPDNVEPNNNIEIRIEDVVLPTGVFVFDLNVEVGNKMVIYDVVNYQGKDANNNPVLKCKLLKYECPNVDYTNLPFELNLNNLPLRPSVQYTSEVTIPSLNIVNIDQIISAISESNLTLNGSGAIAWTVGAGGDILDNFGLDVLPLNEDGRYQMISMMFVSPQSVFSNWSYITVPPVIVSRFADGTANFVLTGFGTVKCNALATGLVSVNENKSSMLTSISPSHIVSIYNTNLFTTYNN